MTKIIRINQPDSRLMMFYREYLVFTAKGDKFGAAWALADLKRYGA